MLKFCLLLLLPVSFVGSFLLPNVDGSTESWLNCDYCSFTKPFLALSESSREVMTGGRFNYCEPRPRMCRSSVKSDCLRSESIKRNWCCGRRSAWLELPNENMWDWSTSICSSLCEMRVLELYLPSLGLGEPIDGAEEGFGPMEPPLRGDLLFTGN